MIGRPRARIEPFNAGLINYPHMQIVRDAYLTGKTRVVAKILFGSKYRTLSIADLAWITSEYLNTASCAARIPTAAVENIDTAVFDGQNQLFADRRFERDRSASRFGGDLFH
jgi:hypothetical protein